jgi:hypothetical protein
MINSGNKRKELEHILNKENFVKITVAIKQLRDESPFKGAIGLLVSYYDGSDNDSVKRLIKDFLNDLKDPSSCSEVMTEIKKDIKPETLRMLVSSCWQSGLNYAGYSDYFVDLFLSGDYMTAIECFTVLESSVQHMSRINKDALIKIILEGIQPVDNDKIALVKELISVLE